MKIDNLIKTIKQAYQEAVILEKEDEIRFLVYLAKKKTTCEQKEKLEKLKKMNMSEKLIEDFNLLFNKEMEEYNSKIENLTLDEKKPINENNRDKYIEAVKSFTAQGGKNFYDIGAIASIKYKQDVEVFLSKIKELQDLGKDIKILKEEKLGNDKYSSFKTESRFAIVMPSSVYHDYEKMMVDNFPEEIYETNSPILRDNYFIPPLIELRKQIEKGTKEMLLRIDLPKEHKKKESINRYVFSAFGYSTVELDTKGGYGVFDDYDPANKAIIEAVGMSLTNATIYGDNPRHSNSMMATLMCYTKKEREERNISLDKKQRITIEHGLKGYEVENKINILKRKQRKI
jgi:hypothetical protein